MLCTGHYIQRRKKVSVCAPVSFVHPDIVLLCLHEVKLFALDCDRGWGTTRLPSIGERLLPAALVIERTTARAGANRGWYW